MIDLKNNKFLKSISPIILYLFLVFNGILGIDFGEHWDENSFIRPACESIESGVFLPHEYISLILLLYRLNSRRNL